MSPWAHLAEPEVQRQSRPISLLSIVLLSAPLFYIYIHIHIFHFPFTGQCVPAPPLRQSGMLCHVLCWVMTAWQSGRKLTLWKKTPVNSFLFLLILLYQDSSAKHLMGSGQTPGERVEVEDRTRQLPAFTASLGAGKGRPSSLGAGELLSLLSYSRILRHVTFDHLVAAS